MATQPAPASAQSKEVTAVGATIPAAGGYIPTNNMPTVMAPQPTPPAATPVPSPAFSPDVAAPPLSKSHRGLYMTLGALVVVAILVAAALEVPRFRKARADGEQISQVTTADSTSSVAVAPKTPSIDANAQPQVGALGSSPVAASPSTGAGQATGVVSGGNGGNPQVDSGGFVSAPSGSPSIGNPTNPTGHGGSTPPSPKKAPREHENGANPAGGGGQVGSTPVAVAADHDSQPTKQNSAVSAQELEELGDLQTKLQVRAETESSNVENLRKQMESGGNNLRSDVENIYAQI
jgi:hypothetical protein